SPSRSATTRPPSRSCATAPAPPTCEESNNGPSHFHESAPRRPPRDPRGQRAAARLLPPHEHARRRLRHPVPQEPRLLPLPRVRRPQAPRPHRRERRGRGRGHGLAVRPPLLRRRRLVGGPALLRSALRLPEEAQGALRLEGLHGRLL